MISVIVGVWELVDDSGSLQSFSPKTYHPRISHVLHSFPLILVGLFFCFWHKCLSPSIKVHHTSPAETSSPLSSNPEEKKISIPYTFHYISLRHFLHNLFWEIYKSSFINSAFYSVIFLTCIQYIHTY